MCRVTGGAALPGAAGKRIGDRKEEASLMVYVRAPSSRQALVMGQLEAGAGVRVVACRRAGGYP